MQSLDRPRGVTVCSARWPRARASNAGITREPPASRIPRLSAAGADRERPLRTGFVPRNIEFDGEAYRYAVYVPDGYTPARRWPVILSLHGKGECGSDGEFHTTVGLGKAIRENPQRFEALVVMPQMPVGRRWQGPMLDLALATLQATLSEYSGDPDRVVLTGLSLGGYGTWSLGARCPERFCALVPICGGGDPDDAAGLATLPIWCFHGAADRVVPVQRSREMVQAIRRAGGDVRYTELPGVEHNSWDITYGDPEVVAWMLSQRRQSS
jgi:predicted peptidase